MLRADKLRHRSPQLRFNPLQRGNQSGLFVLQLLCKAGGEVRLQNHRLSFQLGQRLSHAVLTRARAGGQPVRPQIRRLADPLFFADAHRKSGQRLYQSEAQQYRKHPEFGYGERRGFLVPRHRIHQTLFGDGVVGLENGVAGQVAYQQAAAG